MRRTPHRKMTWSEQYTSLVNFIPLTQRRTLIRCTKLERRVRTTLFIGSTLIGSTKGLTGIYRCTVNFQETVRIVKVHFLCNSFDPGPLRKPIAFHRTSGQ
ncbi:hypothetical protein T265_04043 [Opisthorchis viverrini]|uniref:Uncharacterized protein n=1 Tax=Opisthorchis viverrini TaxID=6198 RepID=A0A074ZQC6_OPIVI|nr:hypothetical protein T265_04043 [Opisthorchis viverrini]KER29296.1 hypothetical protein T265_04043 [Opisthorchis viverrini]